MTLWKLSARQIRARPGRAILTLLSVVIGVAAVVSVTMATTTARRAYREMYETMTGKAALEVVAEGGGSFEAEVLPQIARTPGVRAAVPVIQRPTIVYLKDHKVKAVLLGIDPQTDGAVRNYELVGGQMFVDGRGVLLGTGFAKSLGVQINDQIKLLTKRGPQKATVVGLLAPKGPAAFTEGGVLFLPLKAAQNLFKAQGRLDAIHLVLEASADEPAVVAAVVRQLPVGLTVRRAVARTQMADEMLRSSQQGLNLATGLSLVLAVFIILNTFLMSVGERRRQLAIMRAIGATRRQIMRMLLAEGLALGAAGTLFGVLTGLAGAYFLTRAMERLLQMPLPAIRVTPLPFALGGAFGVSISLLGTIIPAWKAGKVTPLEGMRVISTEDAEGVPRLVAVAGGGALLVAGACALAVLQGWASPDWAASAGILAMVGLASLIPAGIGPLARGVAAALFPVLRIEGHLAERQILRRRTRSALTVGVLLVAVSTGVGMGNALTDNVNDVRDWYQKSLVGDFFVRAMMPNMADGTTADMPEELGAELRRIPGVVNLDTVRVVRTRASGQEVLVIAREFTGDKDQVSLDLEDADPAEVRRRLFAGEVVIGTVLANRIHLGKGDQIVLETRQGPRSLRIAATTNTYTVGGLVMYMQRRWAEELLAVEGVDAYVVKADKASLESVERALTDLCERDGLLLQSYADITRLIDGMVAGIVGCLWVILALGFVVASFGIVNTLTMNVLEQTRELGLLRVIAMTRWQVRKMILAQAVIMGVSGLVPGTCAGLAVAYLINKCAMPALGHPIAFAIHPALVCGAFAAAFASVVAAAWVPAERAARLDLVEALQYE